METSLKIQMDVKNNAQELQNYMLDMNNWEEEMRKKEIALSNEKPQQNPIPPPRNKIKRNQANKNHSSKPKKISAYDYSAWDKFDVEKACAEIDEDSDAVEETVHQESVLENDETIKDDVSNANENLTLIDEAFYEKEMGNQFVKKGQWADAIKCYTNAINLHPSNAIYYANRSLCFLKLQNFKSAETDATTAIQLDKNYVKAYQRRALARQALRQLVEAKSDYQQILIVEPNNALAKAEINKIDEVLKKEQGKTESMKKATFEYKNIFKGEEIKKKKEENAALSSEKKETALKHIESGKSHKLPFKETKKTEKRDINSETNLENLEKQKQNLENKPQFFKKGDGDKEVAVQPESKIFKPLSDWCKIVHPTQLPPHKRSKKLLRRINITLKDEVIDFTGDAKTMQTIPCDSNKLERQTFVHETGSENEFESEKVSFEVPKTAIQFQNYWKIIRNNPNLSYSFLKKIPGRELEHIFENSLESSFFSELIAFLASNEVKKEAKVVYDFLLGLTKVKRFRSLILFMSESDRASIKKCIGEFEGVCSKEDISELLKLYELKV